MKLIHAEKMFSHSTPSIPLDETYTDFSVEKLFAEYKKAIPELTIDESIRLKEEIKIKDGVIQKQESEKDALIKDYGERLAKTEKILSHFKIED